MNGQETWGIIIRNDALAVFHDIRVQAVSNEHKKARRMITVRTLPHGQFFVQSMPYGSDQPWGSTIALANDAKWVPLLDAESRRVEAIDFTDTSAHSWTWSHSRGLIARQASGQESVEKSANDSPE